MNDYVHNKMALESDSSSDESEGFCNVTIPAIFDNFDWPTDESVDAHTAYSICNICHRKLKGRCFSESCLHKFCCKCSHEIIFRTRRKHEKRNCPVCRKSFRGLNLWRISNNDDWENPDDLSWKRFSYAFRTKVYARNLWIQDFAVVSENYKEFTLQFYKDNPSQVQRLIQWLKREIRVLSDFSESELTSDYVIQRICSLLDHHSIKSNEFKSAILPFFGAKTDHFVHEFYMFASSLYDMHSFDDHAFYHALIEGQRLKMNVYLDIQEHYIQSEYRSQCRKSTR